jgi:glycosyltransferase involved in cell wall biosynthesis
VLERNRKVLFDIVARDAHPWTYRADFEREHPELLDRVRFHSVIFDEEKKALLRRCHMMAAPSHYESFGLMYVEAMAFGRAVIGCPVGGVPEIVTDGETGLLVKPDDEAALAEAILALADDRDRCAALGRAGRERFLSHFTAERMARETAEFYEAMMSQPRA